MEGFPTQRSQKSQAPINLAQPFSPLELRANNGSIWLEMVSSEGAGFLDKFHRVARETLYYRCDSSRWRSLRVISPSKTQRKNKGQQLKGKIVSALFHTFPHFFPQDFLLKSSLFL